MAQLKINGVFQAAAAFESLSTSLTLLAAHAASQGQLALRTPPRAWTCAPSPRLFDIDADSWAEVGVWSV